jgi:dolichol-phosphate mannosyltransferase
MIPVELAIIIPTFNERSNIRPLLERLEHVLHDISWEVIFVDDDSSDGTAGEILSVATIDRRVRCLRRVGRRGLSSACIEGLASTPAPFLAVIDADLQHDETRLPLMLDTLRTEELDLVIGSRYIVGGGVAKDWNTTRQYISRLATGVGQRLLRANVADPMSGFFMLRREVFWDAVHRLSGRGFKILLDLLASSPRPLRVRELPYTFRPRQAGESKLDSMVAVEYGTLLLDKLIGHILPLRFILFVLVGSTGAILHLAILGGLHRGFGYRFGLAQAVASVCAMVLNFGLNNLLTYRDRRLRGYQFIFGLFLFIMVCSVGAFTNVHVAEYLFRQQVPWWFAGLIGAGIGAVWNYAVSSQFVWRSKAIFPQKKRALVQ